MSTENSPEELGYTRPAAPAPHRFPIPPGTPSKACRSCHAEIYWIVTTAGRRMPVETDGVSHFARCPNATEHRKVDLELKERSVLRAIAGGRGLDWGRRDNRIALDVLTRKRLVALATDGVSYVVTDLGKSTLGVR